MMKDVQAVFPAHIQLLPVIVSESILSKVPHLNSPIHVVWYFAIEF